MGLLDVIAGRRKLKAPAPDRLFALTTANVTLETELGIRSRGKAGIVFQPLDTADFSSTQADMEEVVHAAAAEAGTKVKTSDDSFGFRWMVLEDPEVDDLVVGVNAIGTALVGGGYGERILCAVFAFENAKGQPLYWIYNYKRGRYYPFVPADGGEGESRKRDTERELKLKAQVGGELPIEPELERWFPLWDIPI